MLINKEKILEEIEFGEIIIEPFTETNLGVNSYDITLSNEVWFSNDQKKRLYISDRNIDEDLWKRTLVKDFVQFYPKETVRCVSGEIVGTLSRYVILSSIRSSLMRLGFVGVFGTGDVGYKGRWVFTLTNMTNSIINIRVGARVGQVLFAPVKPGKEIYSGKYIEGGSLFIPDVMKEGEGVDIDEREFNLTFAY